MRISEIEREKKNKELLSECILFLGVIVLSVVKFIISERLMPYIIAYNVHDDAWVVNIAENIVQGKWMGEYSQMTMIKGIFSPLFLSVSYLLGMDYFNFFTLIYIISCVVFMKAISRLFRYRISVFLFFAILLFNPICFGLDTFQRVYRNCFSQWELLLLVGALFALYLRRKENLLGYSVWGWQILAGISLWVFCNTREDAVWIYPFVFVAIFVTAISRIKDCIEKNASIKKILLIILFCCFPFFLLLIGNTTVKCINYSYYGLFKVNDRTHGNFAEAMKDIYKIAPTQEEIERFSSKEEYVNVWHSTIERVYEVSPSFSELREALEKEYDKWESCDIYSSDGELSADHIIFAIRDAARDVGYYVDARETEDYFGRVHEELSLAYKEGKLVKRGICFSSGVVPFSKEFIDRTFSEMYYSIKEIVFWNRVYSDLKNPLGDKDSVSKFEKITRRSSSTVSFPHLLLSGSIETNNLDDACFINVINENGVISVINALTDENSIPEDGKGYSYDFSHFEQGGEWNKDIYLEVNVNSELVARYLLNNEGLVSLFSKEDVDVSFAEVSFNDGEDFNRESWGSRIANSIIDIYWSTAPIICFFVLGALLFEIVVFIFKKNERMNPIVLFELALCLSLILFSFCIAYVTVTTFNGRVCYYLSSGYILWLMIIGLSICVLLDELFFYTAHNLVIRK